VKGKNKPMPAHKVDVHGKQHIVYTDLSDHPKAKPVWIAAGSLNDTPIRAEADSEAAAVAAWRKAAMSIGGTPPEDR
jgi:hypothetical protein